MHYMNGREAKNGDRIVVVNQKGEVTRLGILYDATPGNDTCNGRMAEMRANDVYTNLAECLHADDVKTQLGELKKVPDSTNFPKGMTS